MSIYAPCFLLVIGICGVFALALLALVDFVAFDDSVSFAGLPSLLCGTYVSDSESGSSCTVLL